MLLQNTELHDGKVEILKGHPLRVLYTTSISPYHQYQFSSGEGLYTVQEFPEETQHTQVVYSFHIGRLQQTQVPIAQNSNLVNQLVWIRSCLRLLIDISKAALLLKSPPPAQVWESCNSGALSISCRQLDRFKKSLLSATWLVRGFSMPLGSLMRPLSYTQRELFTPSVKLWRDLSDSFKFPL